MALFSDAKASIRHKTIAGAFVNGGKVLDSDSCSIGNGVGRVTVGYGLQLAVVFVLNVSGAPF